MELVLILWIVGTLPAIGEFLVVGGIVGAVSAFTVKLFMLAEKVGLDEPGQKTATKFMYAMIPIALVGSLIPDKETSYQMLAAYGVQTVIENPKAKELASDGVDVLKALMTKAKKELAEDAENR